MVSQTSVRHDTEDPRLGRAACGKKKNSHYDGGERGTHTSATDPCESGMKRESVHMSSKQDHQGIRTTQHIVSKPDRSNNAIDIFVRSKQRDLVFLADLIVEIVLSALVLFQDVRQIRQLRRVLLCKHLLDEHFIPVVSERASLTQRYCCCQHISHHGRSDTNSKKETYLNLRAGRRQERNTATNEHIILKEPKRRSLSRT